MVRIRVGSAIDIIVALPQRGEMFSLAVLLLLRSFLGVQSPSLGSAIIPLPGFAPDGARSQRGLSCL